MTAPGADSVLNDFHLEASTSGVTVSSCASFDKIESGVAEFEFQRHADAQPIGVLGKCVLLSKPFNEARNVIRVMRSCSRGAALGSVRGASQCGARTDRSVATFVRLVLIQLSDRAHRKWFGRSAACNLASYLDN